MLISYCKCSVKWKMVRNCALHGIREKRYHLGNYLIYCEIKAMTVIKMIYHYLYGVPSMSSRNTSSPLMKLA